MGCSNDKSSLGDYQHKTRNNINQVKVGKTRQEIPNEGIVINLYNHFKSK